MAGVGLSGFKDYRGPFGFVGAVGVMLRLEADACALLVNLTIFTGLGSVEEITGIYLNTGFVGVDGELDTANGRFKSNG